MAWKDSRLIEPHNIPLCQPGCVNSYLRELSHLPLNITATYTDFSRVPKIQIAVKYCLGMKYV